MNGLMNNFYQLLNLDLNADFETVNQQFLYLSKQTISLHEKIQIYQAYRVLSDPVKRSQYDKSLLMGLLSNSTNEPHRDNRLKTIQNNYQPSNLCLPSDCTYAVTEKNEDYYLPQSMRNNNQREYPRFPFKNSILINEGIAANTLNISPKGLQIQLSELFDETQPLNFQSEQINGLAKICFVTADEQRGTIVGLYFLKVKFNPQLIIDEYI